MASSGGAAHEAAMVSSVVRVKGGDGAAVGAGFLIADDTVVTCAHVVSDALDQPRDLAVAVGTEVMLDVPFAVDRPEGSAKVLHWVPVREDQGGDVAVLRLDGALPGVRPLAMADAGDVWDHETRAVGFTADAPDGNWQQGRFRGPVGTSLVQLSRADGQAVHVRPGFSGSPVWDDDLGVAVGMVVASEPARETQQAFVMRTEAVAEAVPALRELLLPTKPFLGLKPFEEDDRHLFFGRDDDIARVVTALEGDHPSVTVCGPSGSGKSSLVLAGVVPLLRGAGWEILVLDCSRVKVPRAALATELFERAAAGARAAHADQVDGWLRELGVVDAAHRATGRTTGRLLVVLDQAEALLNLDEPHLTEALDLLFPPRPTNLRVLATLRADVMNTALKHPRLGSVLTAGLTVPLTPMDRDQLHTVITRPLERTPGVTYEPGLDLRILDDAGTDPGVLPLLGFLLEQLWNEERGPRLSAATYQEIGGVKGALVRHARQVWDSCVPPGSEEEARRLLAGLVRVVPGGEATLRRPLTREEAGEERWRLARAMSTEDKRLLVLHGGDGRPESAELVHEALITQWPELAEAVRVDADFLNARAEVRHDQKRWVQAECPADLLPGGFQLESLTKRLGGRENELDQDQRDFLAVARRKRRRDRRRAWYAWAAATLACVFIATLITFNVLESRDRARQAGEARSRALAVQSDDLVATNPGHAALAAVAAYETAPTQEARNSLLRRYSEARSTEWLLSGAEGKFQNAAMSADGRVTLVTTDGGRALLFVRTARGKVRQESLRLGPIVDTPRVSFDGRRISYVRREDGAVVWHEVTFTARKMVGSAHPLDMPDEAAPGAAAHFKETAFSRDGRFLVESGDDAWTAGVVDQSNRPVRVWDLETGRPRVLPKKYSIATAAWFGPDNRTVVLASASGSLIAVDVRTGKMRRLTASFKSVPQGEQGGSWVSADGTVVLSCRGDSDSSSARYKAIRVADGRVLSDRRWDRGSSCGPALLDPSGKRFALNTGLDDWEVAETGGDARPRKFTGPSIGSSKRVPFPLLGTAHSPSVPVRGDTKITGHRLTDAEGETAFGTPTLLGDGSSMLVRTGSDGDKLMVVETEGNQRVLSEVSSKGKTPPADEQLIAVNRSQTLMAYVTGESRVIVRRLPSLKKVSAFTVARPPLKEGSDERDPVALDFQPDDRLVTLSGARIEYWDTGDGRRLRSPIDVKDLGLTSGDKPEYLMAGHRASGVIGVLVPGTPNLYAIDLRTGRERKNLRVTFDEDLLTASFLRDRRYLAVLTTGRIVELWSAEPGQSPRRVVGPFGPLEPGEFAVGNPSGADFFVAYGSTVVFLKADAPADRDTYKFGADQHFAATNTTDGKALLGSPSSEDPERPSGGFDTGPLKLTRLDPDLWKRHLCEVLGRTLTGDERSALSGPLPDTICPA
ncbi:nSTAND1 domain-containing NTPase [Streptomyces sp. BYX5S]